MSYSSQSWSNNLVGLFTKRFLPGIFPAIFYIAITRKYLILKGHTDFSFYNTPLGIFFIFSFVFFIGLMVSLFIDSVFRKKLKKMKAIEAKTLFYMSVSLLITTPLFLYNAFLAKYDWEAIAILLTWFLAGSFALWHNAHMIDKEEALA